MKIDDFISEFLETNNIKNTILFSNEFYGMVKRTFKNKIL